MGTQNFSILWPTLGKGEILLRKIVSVITSLEDPSEIKEEGKDHFFNLFRKKGAHHSQPQPKSLPSMLQPGIDHWLFLRKRSTSPLELQVNW